MKIEEKIDKYLNESKFRGLLKGKPTKTLIKNMNSNFNNWIFKTNLPKYFDEGIIEGKINFMDYGMVFEASNKEFTIKESKRGEFYELYENEKYVEDFDSGDSVYLRKKMLEIIWKNSKKDKNFLSKLPNNVKNKR